MCILQDSFPNDIFESFEGNYVSVDLKGCGRLVMVLSQSSTSVFEGVFSTQFYGRVSKHSNWKSRGLVSEYIKT